MVLKQGTFLWCIDRLKTALLTFLRVFTIIRLLFRAIAQLVSVQVWGTWGRRFKSALPDFFSQSKNFTVITKIPYFSP